MPNDIQIYLGYEVERLKAVYSESAKRYGACDHQSMKILGQIMEAERIKQAIETLLIQPEKE